MKEKEIIYLIREARSQNKDSFMKLIEYYMKDMYKVSISILNNDEDAADDIQDTILACWEKMHTLKELKYFKTWMTRILINSCYDIRKQQMKFVPYEEETQQGVTELTNDRDNNYEIKEALLALDEKYRVPIILFYGQGYRIKEIADILHMPMGTVQTRLSRGRKQLKKYYGVEEE